jgi:hypothetical protein
MPRAPVAFETRTGARAPGPAPLAARVLVPPAEAPARTPPDPPDRPPQQHPLRAIADSRNRARVECREGRLGRPRVEQLNRELRVPYDLDRGRGELANGVDAELPLTMNPVPCDVVAHVLKPVARSRIAFEEVTAGGSLGTGESKDGSDQPEAVTGEDRPKGAGSPAEVRDVGADAA